MAPLMRGKKSFEELMSRAKQVAKYRGFENDAEDFAQWLACQYLQEKSLKQTVDQSFIDFLRREYGSPRKDRQQGSDALLPKRRFVPNVQKSEYHKVLDGVMTSAMHALDFQEDEPLKLRLADFLRGRDLTIAELYASGWRMQEIARELKLTESRVSQIMQMNVAWIKNQISQCTKRVRPCMQEESVSTESIERIDRQTAAEICGVSYQTFCNWVDDKLIMPVMIGSRAIFKREDLDRIRALRAKHGRSWSRHVEDRQPIEEELSEAEECVEAESESDYFEVSDPKTLMQLEVYRKLVARARALDSQGKRESAIEILWAVVDDLFEVPSAA